MAPMVRRATLGVAPVALALVSLISGSAGGAGPARTPGAVAQAWAIKVLVPGQAGGASPVVVSPPRDSVSFLAGFQYPSDGSVVSAGAITIAARASAAANAVATASSDISSLSLFGGEITASGISGRARAGAGAAGSSGDFAGAGIAILSVLGQAVAAAPNARVALADWGYALTLTQSVDTSAPAGASGYRGFTTALDVHLSADHGGLPAGSEILVGYADAAAQTAPPPVAARPEVPSAPATETHVAPEPRKTPGLHDPLVRKPPTNVTPKLTAGGYVFPVYGPSSYIDTYGAGRADVSYHHGDDIFGQLGQPLLAVADGTVFSVGWNDVGGYRLWLRDKQGNQFYYAHLSAFSTLAVDGAHVKAGQVVGFMGSTGDAAGTPTHVHFEVHPVSLLFLGYDGAVNPTSYLDAWRRLEDLSFPLTAGWAPLVPGGARAPQPGAILLQASDISAADGLDPGSLQRALVAPVPAEGDGVLVPVTGPQPDPGRG